MNERAAEQNEQEIMLNKKGKTERKGVEQNERDIMLNEKEAELKKTEEKLNQKEA
jgi:hypothetical protein